MRLLLEISILQIFHLLHKKEKRLVSRRFSFWVLCQFGLSFGISKSFAKMKWCIGAKVLGIFKGLFQKSLKARFGTAVPTCFANIKKHGIAVLFVLIECWGYPPQTRTQRTFLEKSFGIPKALLK